MQSSPIQIPFFLIHFLQLYIVLFHHKILIIIITVLSKSEKEYKNYQDPKFHNLLLVILVRILPLRIFKLDLRKILLLGGNNLVESLVKQTAKRARC